ncbi:hypothetical protein [Mesorhizobium sp. M0698]|uniref:hypothetical protein n=1 Tax=Mesorhizobium sp. M0698 TaxID=2956987 RepID=UPI003336F925
MTTINASRALAPGGEIITESGGAIISEQRGGFVGIGSSDILEDSDRMESKNDNPHRSSFYDSGNFSEAE